MHLCFTLHVDGAQGKGLRPSHTLRTMLHTTPASSRLFRCASSTFIDFSLQPQRKAELVLLFFGPFCFVSKDNISQKRPLYPKGNTKELVKQ